MDTDNSWTSGGESGYCATYPALYEGARQAIRFCPCYYQTISNIHGGLGIAGSLQGIAALSMAGGGAKMTRWVQIRI
jgi:hypothetical protein